ncbi:L-lactate permease [Mammaliicoccus sciuri]|uniref:L-lactate permease n=1 Tax=Mammaliicoccus sciuri TaxID=1296 RepID=UPI001FB53354|nr:L-lactate permease [Mammaliicoccus sciuri]MCJ0952341.1 L-lactate permease [Mammaliicoccus sciuri]
MNLLIAILPLLIIFICLFIFKWSALKTGITAFLSTVILVFINSPYHISFEIIMNSTISGILISSVAAYVIFFGVLLFHLMNESGKINDISNQMKNLTNDTVLQIIILSIGISPLVESTSGFGTAFLVITPILISLGISNYKAACIGILSLLAVPWGALATGTVIGTEIVNLNLKFVGFLTAILTFTTIVFFLSTCLFILGGSKTLYNNIFKTLIYASSFSLTNIIFNYFVSVELAGVFSSLITLLIGIININIQNKNITIKDYRYLTSLLSPYILLTSLVFMTRTISIFEEFLKNHFVISFEKYNYQLMLLYSPAFWLVITCIYTIIRFNINKSTVRIALQKTFRQWGLFVISTTLFIALAEIMDASGMINSISTSLGNNLGNYFIIISGAIGSIGGFLTGSNTGANAMFMKLQIHTAHQLDLSTGLIAGLQNASASNATMSTPSRIMLATELCEIKDQETKLQSQIIKIVILSTLLLITTTFLIRLMI